MKITRNKRMLSISLLIGLFITIFMLSFGSISASVYAYADDDLLIENQSYLGEKSGSKNMLDSDINLFVSAGATGNDVFKTYQLDRSLNFQLGQTYRVKFSINGNMEVHDWTVSDSIEGMDGIVGIGGNSYTYIDQQDIFFAILDNFSAEMMTEEGKSLIVFQVGGGEAVDYDQSCVVTWLELLGG